MDKVGTSALGLGFLILVLGCDDAFVLGDEGLPDSLNGGSKGFSSTGGQSGGGSGGDGATGGDGTTGGDGATGADGATGDGGGTGATGGTSTTDGGGTGGGGGTGTTGGGGGTSSPPVTGGDGATGGTLELADCSRTSLPMSDGPDAIATPGDPRSGATGDFNHDGALDLATIDAGGTVSVYFGQGDGSFSSSDSYSTGLGKLTDGAGSIVAADLDDNSELDLVTTLATAGVSVLLGAHDGSFDAEVTYDVSLDAWGVVVGDWTGDHIADLVVVGTTNNNMSVSVLEGQGDGSFGGEEPFWQGGYTRAIAAADLEADGDLDLVVSGNESVTVLGNEGFGGLEYEDGYLTEPGGDDVTIADFSGDHVLDIVVESNCDGDVEYGLTMLLGKGDGSFEQGVFHETISCPHRTMAGDVNGDDVPDMVGDLHRVMLSDGNGGFLPLPEVSGPSTLVGGLVGLGDFDGDGKLDAATASTGWLAVRTGRGDGTFRSAPVIELEPVSGSSGLVVADLDGNDTPDIVANGWWSLDVLLGAGDGSFAAPVTYDADAPEGLYALDFNDDGNLDLATLDLQGGVNVLLATDPGAYGPGVRYATGDLPTVFAAGNVDADEIVDFATFNLYPPFITVLIGEGNGRFVALPDQLLTGRPNAFALFDTNQDDLLDLVLADGTTQLLTVWFGLGDGTFAPGPDTSTDDLPLSALEFGHIDGDNMLDLVVVNWGEESLPVLLSNGDGSFRATNSPDLSASFARVIDFNQDGKNDVVVSVPVAYGHSHLGVLFGNGDGSFACKREFGIWGEAEAFDVADVDMDGRVEVVTRTDTDISVFPNLPR